MDQADVMNDQLAKAAQAGLEAVGQWQFAAGLSAKACEAVTRAVLETLGIKWDGEWEWRVTWAAGWNWKAGLSEAQAREVQSREGGTLQRRPHLSVAWQTP